MGKVNGNIFVTLEMTREEFYDRTITPEGKKTAKSFTDEELEVMGVESFGVMNGFCQISNETRVLCAQVGGIQAVGLYLTLLSHVNIKNAKSEDNYMYSCHPSIPTLMKETGMSNKTIDKYIKLLKDAGLIEYLQGDNLTHMANRYFFPLEPQLYTRDIYLVYMPLILKMQANKKNAKNKDIETRSKVSNKPVETLKDIKATVEPVEEINVSEGNTECHNTIEHPNVIEVAPIIESKKIKPKVVDDSTLGLLVDNSKEESMLDINTVGIETTTKEVINKEVNVGTIISGMETLKEITDENKFNYGSYDVKDFEGNVINISYGDITSERGVMYSYIKEIPENIMTTINNSKENKNDKLYKVCVNCVPNFDSLEHWITALKTVA